MIPYLFAYGISIFFTLFLTKVNKNKLLSLMYICLVFISISIFSGLRDLSIGKDISTYGIQVFNKAVEVSRFSNFLYFQSGGENIEAGYLFFNFIISRFTNSMHLYLFFHALLVNGLAAIAFYKLRKYANFSFMWFSYLMLVYPYTLTMLRQSIAQVIIFFAIIWLLTSKKSLRSFLLIICALTMHNSAFIGIPLFVIVLLFNNNMLGKKGVVLSLSAAFLLASSIKFILPSILSSGYLSEKYNMYDGSYASPSLLNPLLVRSPLVFLLYFSWWRSDTKDNEETTLAYLAVLEIVLQPIKLFDYNIARISWYLSYFMGIGYAISLKDITIGKIRFLKEFSIIMAVIILLYIGLYSNIYEQNIGIGGLGVYPYSFFK